MSKQYGVRLSDSVAKRLEDAAKAEGRDNSELARMAIEIGLPIIEEYIAAGKSPFMAIRESATEPKVTPKKQSAPAHSKLPRGQRAIPKKHEN